MMIPILLINRMKEFWGADADTFKYVDQPALPCL
jgi:hypothetical protein